ncbi:hypothetical protein [Nocardia farcinica]|uniref:hypothetical protein n=1 Tax=Nocardia farcinica TaxID=37329 RepID=UPI00189486E3|nr:hypothetical protein [Nocardia farcinica]MBF6185066.1 hypothetical protein [Nocardia farcinica]MBF6363966.1 hypothetical protein [Nocardia farcinica]
MPETGPEHTIFYGSTPDRPLAFTVPPVEATPDRPLPDAGPFLRVCAGVEEPNTVMLRVARELAGVWRHVHYERPKDTTKTNEQLVLIANLGTGCARISTPPVGAGCSCSRIPTPPAA